MLATRYSIKQRSYVDMDYNSTSCILILAGMPAGSSVTDSSNVPPIYASYQMKHKSLQPLGRMSGPRDAVMLNKLRFLAKGSDTFIAGMT